MHWGDTERNKIINALRICQERISELEKQDSCDQEALIQCKATFENLFELSPEALILVDSKGNVSRMNVQAEKLFGYERQELIGKDHGILVPKKQMEKHERELRAYMQHPGIRVMGIGMGLRGLRKDESEFAVDIDLGPLVMQGEIFVISVVRDATERKKLEDGLLASEKRYHGLYDSIRDGILRTDLSGHILGANKAFLDMLGYPPRDLSLLTHQQITPDKWHEREATVAQRLVLQRGYTDEYEKEYIRKDGSIVPVSLRLWIMRDEEGRPDGMWGIVRDITEVKRAELALRESEEKYRRLFTNMSLGYAYCEMAFGKNNIPLDFTYIEVNDAFEHLTGLKRNDVLGKKVTEVIPTINETNPEIIPAYGKVVQTGEPTAFEVFFRPLEMWLSVRAYRPEDGYFVAIFENITEHKKAEKVLLDRTRALEEANNELQQFAYVVSHDLREPLRIVTSFTQNLEQRYKNKLDKTADEYIQFIVDGAARMQNLIDDILAYSRVGTRGASFEIVDMENVLRQATANLKITIEESGAQITHDSLPVVSGDLAQLTQVMQNLLGNGIKFHRQGVKPVIHVAVKLGLDEWEFSVRDNGIGIDNELFGRLFTLFQRLNPEDKYKGTGVGLAVAKRIIQRHGGRIWIASQPGEGSTFIFTIPSTPRRQDDDKPE
jgi:PAS domain S-box-containing protein